MSKLRSINTVIWSDTWFELLDPSAKLLFIYLFTNEKTNMLGVYEISTRKVSFETGIPVKNIEKYLKEFEKECKIKYAKNRVLLLNFLKHQNYNFNMMKSAIRTYNKLPNELKILNINNIDESKEGFETLCKGFTGVRKVEYEYEEEREEEYEIESESESKKKIEIDFKEIIDVFNSVCTELPKVEKITEKRKKVLKSRIDEYSLEEIGDVFKKVSKSGFLCGNSENGWKANFDWILKPSNFIKIKEDNYKNRNGNKSNNTGKTHIERMQETNRVVDAYFDGAK